CRQDDGIRFLGSAIATMLSVSLSTLFGTPGLDEREKRALVFTDSVQDAAHRAGFVQSRSHALTLRTLLRQALADGETDLESLAHRILDIAGDDPGARYRLLPPELAERADFEKFWTAPTARSIPTRLRRFVLRRLMLDIQLEFGLRAGVGRTLERTGSAIGYVTAGVPLLLAAARAAVDAPDVQLTLGIAGTHTSLGTPDAQMPSDYSATLTGPADALLARWRQVLLVHTPRRGAMEHLWFDKFRTEAGNRWWITGGRRRNEG